MKTITKILRIMLTILILTVLPFIVFTLITSKTNVLGGIQSFVVLTGSMQPSIPQGSIVYTRKTRNYENGDIVSYKQGDLVVTHRITEVVYAKDAKGIFYRTQGDANNNVDSEVVAQRDVLGKSIFFVPYVGKLVLFLKTFPGYAIFIIFPTVFFIVFELNNIRKEIIRQAERRARGLLSPPRWPKDSSEVEGVSN